MTNLFSLERESILYFYATGATRANSTLSSWSECLNVTCVLQTRRSSSSRRRKRTIKDIWKYMENTVNTISPKCACGDYFESCQATITVTVVKTASVISPPRVADTTPDTDPSWRMPRSLTISPKIQLLTSFLLDRRIFPRLYLLHVRLLRVTMLKAVGIVKVKNYRNQNPISRRRKLASRVVKHVNAVAFIFRGDATRREFHLHRRGCCSVLTRYSEHLDRNKNFDITITV